MNPLEKYITLTPAYGRDYKSKKEVLLDFDKNLDFILCTPWGTTYINKEQVPEGTTINFRYKKLQSVTVYTVRPKETK